MNRKMNKIFGDEKEPKECVVGDFYGIVLECFASQMCIEQDMYHLSISMHPRAQLQC